METLKLVEKETEIVAPERPKTFRLQLDAKAVLYLDGGGGRKEVFLKRCFPWSHPLKFWSLRDSNDQEIWLIEDLGQVPEPNRGILLEAIQLTSFCFEVTDVLSVEEDFEMRVWQVETQQGKRQFQTALDQYPYPAPGGGLLVQDVHGDIYQVPPVEELPEGARKQVWAFVD